MQEIKSLTIEIPMSVEQTDQLQSAIEIARQAEAKQNQAINECKTAMMVATAFWEKICIDFQNESGKAFVIPPLFTSQGVQIGLRTTATIMLSSAKNPEIKTIHLRRENQEHKDGEN